MSRFVRASKFRHVYGTGTKKEQCFDNVKPSRNAWDTNLIKANGLYVAVCWEAGGGGAFAVLNQKEDTGKLPAQPNLFQAHKAPVLDIDFHPFNDYVIASASEDCKVMIWNIPEKIDAPQETPAAILGGHSRKVGNIQFHPTADNTLVSAGGDLAMKVWDIEKGVQKVELLGHTDLVNSMSFNYNGSLIATSCRDKKARVFDIRAGKVVQEADGHQGIKGSRIVWLGDTNRIASTGFSKTSDRQMYIRDVSAFDTLLVQENLDTSAGMLMPFYDPDCKMLYLGGKGDANIRYYEMVDDKPWQFLLDEYKSQEPQRGLAFVPKRACDVTQVEVMRCYKLTTSLIEPISFKVPRKTDVFQEDLFPPAADGKAALTCDEYFAGKDANPVTVALDKGFVAGVRKDVNFISADVNADRKDLENPKNEKELRESWSKLKDENKLLNDKLTQKDVQIRALEQKLASLQAK